MLIQPPVAAGVVRQRMVKSGSQSVEQGSVEGASQVTGWASDAAAPAVIAADALVVQGTGAVSVVWAHSTGGGSFRKVQARINSVVVAESPQNTSSGQLTWSGTVADGDRIEMWIWNSAYAAETTVKASGTWIEVTPA